MVGVLKLSSAAAAAVALAFAGAAHASTGTGDPPPGKVAHGTKITVTVSADESEFSDPGCTRDKKYDWQITYPDGTASGEGLSGSASFTVPSDPGTAGYMSTSYSFGGSCYINEVLHNVAFDGPSGDVGPWTYSAGKDGTCPAGGGGPTKPIGLVGFAAGAGCQPPKNKKPQCRNGKDDDGDGFIDHRKVGADGFPLTSRLHPDPGCRSEDDDSEKNPPLAQCEDWKDNDRDGLIDWNGGPYRGPRFSDLGCKGRKDDNERNPRCSDGTDNDHDTLVDDKDPGCESPSDNQETEDCTDKKDNDHDGKTDWQEDIGCDERWDPSEKQVHGWMCELDQRVTAGPKSFASQVYCQEWLQTARFGSDAWLSIQRFLFIERNKACIVSDGVGGSLGNVLTGLCNVTGRGNNPYFSRVGVPFITCLAAGWYPVFKPPQCNHFDLAGTPGPDRIVGTRGANTLTGAEGDDRLDGKGGDDTVNGGPGRDVLVGGAGNDSLLARDGEADVVRCGKGRDRVRADRSDSVAKDCERVSRG